MISMKFVYHSIRGDKTEIDLSWDSLAIIGFSAKNEELIRKHIDELSGMGIASPRETPSIYWIDPSRVSQSKHIYVVGEDTSGEVEVFCAFDDKNEMYITVGSDHTDRRLERESIHKSKQICNKIMGTDCWRFTEIADHADAIEMRCYVRRDKDEKFRLYQKGQLGFLKPLDELKALVERKGKTGLLNRKFSFFSGTVPFLNEAVSGHEYIISLYDPLLKREIRAVYSVVVFKEN